MLNKKYDCQIRIAALCCHCRHCNKQKKTRHTNTKNRSRKKREQNQPIEAQVRLQCSKMKRCQYLSTVDVCVSAESRKKLILLFMLNPLFVADILSGYNISYDKKFECS